jgi:hypothetical protein
MGELLNENNRLEDYTTIEPAPRKEAPEKVDPIQDIAPAKKEKVSSFDRFKQYFPIDEEPPKPRFDPTTPEYLQRAANMNALSRGLSALGDVYTLHKEGNVNRSQPDRETGSYVDNYYRYLDNYRRRLDDYDMVDFQNKMRLGQMMMGQANADRSYNLQRESRDDMMDYRNKTFEYGKERDKLTDERYGNEVERKEKWRKEDKEWQKELMNQKAELDQIKDQRELEQWLQKETIKLQFDKQKDRYNLFDTSGKLVTTVNDEGQIQKLYDVITSDPSMKEIADAQLEVLKPILGEGVTMDHMKVVVSRLWDKSDPAKEWLGVKSPETGWRVPQTWQSGSSGYTTGTQKETQPQAPPADTDEKVNYYLDKYGR